MQSPKNQSRQHTVTRHESRALGLIASLCLLVHCYGQGTMTFTFEGQPRGTISQEMGFYNESGMRFTVIPPGGMFLVGGRHPWVSR